MLFIIGLPCLQIILFCWAIGYDPKGLTLAISNHELNDTGRATQECPIYVGCNQTMLSCRYLQKLKTKNEIIIVSLNTLHTHIN